MLPILRRGLCFVLGDPEDRFSWVSLEDALRMTEFAMRRESKKMVPQMEAEVQALGRYYGSSSVAMPAAPPAVQEAAEKRGQAA